MATRTTKTSKKAPVKSRSKVVKKKSNNSSNSVLMFLKKKPLIVFIVVFGAIGSIFLFRSFAATTNLEAETATKSSEVVIASDASASGGKYAQFANTAPLANSSAQRFPGDPNPKVTGKAYWGANVNALLADGSTTSDVYNRHEKPTGKPLPLYHRYFQWADIDKGSIVSKAKEDHAAGRLPYVTFKATSDWAAIGKGTYDAQLDKVIAGLDALGKPVWVTMQHEPENDTDGSTRTSASYRAMQSRFKARMKAANNGAGTKNIAFMPHLMDSTTRNNGTRNPNDWWVDDAWDLVMFSNYCQRDCVDKGGNTYDTQARTQSINFIESKGLPWGVGEWSLSEPRTGPLKFTAYFQKYWEWGFQNNKDGVAYSYFDADESRPDPTSPYYASLRDANLDAFHNILRSDSRVMRLNELSNSTTTTPTTYGTLTSNITVPTDGTYKLWVRMNAPDSTNNAVSVKFDNGASAKLGDFAIPANTWTWVDYENGNTADKATYSLVAGTRKLTITGIEKGVKVDKFILTDTSCIPTGTGDNCNIVAPPPSTDLPPATPTGVKVTNVGNGEVTVSWNPNTETDFKRFAVRYKVSTNPDSNYVWPATDLTTGSYKFTGLTNGVQYDLEVRAIDQAENKSDYAVVNATPKAAPVADTTAPTTPTNLTATVSSSTVNLTWSKSTDNVGVKDYIIIRDGVQVGVTTGTTFSNTNLANGTYVFKVKARDAANNVSSGVSITKTVNNTVLK